MALVRRVRKWAPALGLGLGLSLGACDRAPPISPDRDEVLERMDDLLPRASSQGTSLPADREAILRELSPLTTEALAVVYAVEGPAGVVGSLEVLARPGGYRRENWTVQVPLGAEGTRQLMGSTIQTPDGVWIVGSAPTEFLPSPLGTLADAYLGLAEDERRLVVERLRARRELLDRGRAEDPSVPERILDVPCHVTRVATIELCLWEATGLPLRYDSGGLRLRAIRIDDQAGIGEQAFELPFTPPKDGVEGFDAVAALRRMAEGNVAEVAPYLHPGLRLPS